MVAEILGRFHPLIVHMPVGMLILAFLIELASKTSRYAQLRSALPFVLQVTVLTSLFAFLTGWIMPKEGDFDEQLISLHLWSAASMTITSILLCYLVYQKQGIGRKLYFPTFVVAMILLTVTGHFGGSLTHGEGHLTKPLTKKTKVIVTDVNQLAIYPDLIVPILKKKCYSCHNEGKKKGELIMTTITDLMTGGTQGPIIVSGDVSNSTLIQRVHLPEDDEEHMPPKGKAQLTNNEVKLIEWWISNGADPASKVADIEQGQEIKEILKGYEQGTSQLDGSKLDIIPAAEIAALAEQHITVVPESKSSPFAFAGFQRDTMIASSKLKKLKNYAENITEIDLSFTNMNDDMMSQLRRYKNLQKLKLQNTQVSSEGLRHLEELQHLTLINLYGTQVDDKAFSYLKKIPALTSIYLWQSKVTDQGVEAFREEKPLIQVSYKIDQSLFGDARLKPPTITAEKDVFEDSLEVTLSLNFKNVDVFYTLDGSIPDSTSMKYDSSFHIINTASIKAITSKEGWRTSEVSEKVFVKAGHKATSATLAKLPNKKYPGQGALSLIDLQKGTASFSDERWIGYEAEHMTATLDLGSNKPIHNIVVGALEDTGSYIFFPNSIEVKTSNDNRNFSPIARLDIPTSTAPNSGELRSFLLEFDETAARYIKVQIRSILKNPEWHAAPGAKNWIFIDEILVN